MDQAGATVAAGTWAARKDQKVWKGSWQARGRSGQLYSGTWRAQPQLPSSAGFSELFEFALTISCQRDLAGGYSVLRCLVERAYPHQ
jgi:hypothetical protein